MTAGGESLILRPERIIDGIADQALVGQEVALEAGQISHVGPTDSSPGAGEIIDLPGMTLLPGLIDCHVHYLFDPDLPEGNSIELAAEELPQRSLLVGARNARTALAAGVTTARSAGAPADLDIALARAIAAGDIPGPRLIPSGRAVTITGGHGTPFGITADTIPEMVGAVRRLVAGGSGVIKIVASEAAMRTDERAGAAEMTGVEIAAIVDEANRLGIHAFAHAQDDDSVGAAAAAGVVSVEHAFLAGEATLEVLAGSGIALTPTLTVTDVYSSLEGLSPAQRSRQEYLSETHRRACETAIGLGVPIVAGTDCGLRGVGADAIGREMDLLVDHGLAAMEAIRAATSRAAGVLGVADEVGSIRPGKAADLVVVVGDPITDPTCLGSPAHVFQQGRRIAGHQEGMGSAGV